MKKCISVIIPSYNRAHLLAKTIPTFLTNDSVGELILINDCSTDNTIEVANNLIKRYPQIKLINLKKNSKQVVAKNIGIKHAVFEYIYFGDDDSFLLPNSIDKLLNSLINYSADLVGARALYLNTENDLNDLDGFLKRIDKKTGRLVNFSKLEFNLDINPGEIIEVPVCQAYFLIKTDVAKQILFDEKYTGNCLREETDFFIRAFDIGYKTILNPFVPQFNLPRNIATGGAHSFSGIRKVLSSLKNNWYFLKKNKRILYDKLGVKHSIIFIQILFTWQLYKERSRKIRFYFKKFIF